MTSYHTLLSLLISLSPTFAKLPCDSLVPEYCALPYPNSYFTMDVPLSESPTGVRVNFSQEFFPRNTLDVPMDPKKWNRFGKEGRIGGWVGGGGRGVWKGRGGGAWREGGRGRGRRREGGRGEGKEGERVGEGKEGGWGRGWRGEEGKEGGGRREGKEGRGEEGI